MMTDSSAESDTQAAVIQSFIVLVPARKVLVSYEITTGNNLPIVHEFVIRFTKSMGSVRADIISQYFGLSGRETEIVVSELIQQGIVRSSANSEIALTEYGDSLFTVDGTGAPRVVNVEPRQNSLWIDLVGFARLPRLRNSAQQLLSQALRLQVGENVSTARAVEGARVTFETGFREEIVGNGRDQKSREDLYRVAAVVPDGPPREIPIEVHATINLDGGPALELEYPAFSSLRDLEARRELLAKVRQTLIDAAPPPAPTAADRFGQVLAGTLLEAARSDGVIDAERAVRLAATRTGNPRSGHVLLGDQSIEANRAIFEGHLNDVWDRRNLLRGKRSRPTTYECVVIAPKSRLWGRSLVNRVLVDSITSKLAMDKRDVRTWLACPTDDFGRNWHRDFARNKALFDFSILLSGTLFESVVEVLLIVDELAMVTFHLRSNDHAILPIPVSVISSAENKVRLIQDELLAGVAVEGFDERGSFGFRDATEYGEATENLLRRIKLDAMIEEERTSS